MTILGIDEQAAIKLYGDDGFCHAQSFFSPAELKEIESNLAQFIENVAPKLTGRDINYSDGQINSIHALAKNSEYFEKLMRSPRVTELARLFLNDEPEPRAMEY